ncbi:Uncharacterized protein TPAR_04178 [Tolypocladium paradoxum]|uniref:Pierisin-like domain-containing protein n=1 Tax=Tolypocladium paradoxum TaxID=94208 RepID=A0A2S4KZL1_9HYPO|nr:Uncharacterized protein TPAR_04178 [Tolypocladium paradoxum]
MKSSPVLALFAGLAIAAPLETHQVTSKEPIKKPSVLNTAAVVPALIPRSPQESRLPSESNDATELDPALIGKTILEIISNDAAPASEANSTAPYNHVERRGRPDSQYQAMPASEAAVMTPKGSGKKGIFFRGDSQPPEQIFKHGFQPRGSDMNLKNHLSHRGKSGYVSISRSRAAAEGYAFGRTGEKQKLGYIYVVSPKGVPEGYWLPAMFSKDGAVKWNREFAAAGAIPATSIYGAYEVDAGKPGEKGRWVENEKYPGKKLSCSIQKRNEAFKLGKEEPKKKVPFTEAKSKKRPVGIKMEQNRFLQWIASESPEEFQPLVDAIRSEEVGIEDCVLALKRALSVTLYTRWSDFDNFDVAAKSIANIVTDVFATSTTKAPVGFFKAVVLAIPDIAKEIRKGKTPKEKLKIANKNLHVIVKAWSYSPAGIVNERLMKEAAQDTPMVKGVLVSLNNLWSYTPLGYVANQVFPVESLIKRGGDARPVAP